jgi:hypothetical protein
MKYQICEIIRREICVPYSVENSNGDNWSSANINEIVCYDLLYDTIEEAIFHFNENIFFSKGTYTILPILIKK